MISLHSHVCSNERARVKSEMLPRCNYFLLTDNKGVYIRKSPNIWYTMCLGLKSYWQTKNLKKIKRVESCYRNYSIEGTRKKAIEMVSMMVNLKYGIQRNGTTIMTKQRGTSK